MKLLKAAELNNVTGGGGCVPRLSLESDPHWGQTDCFNGVTPFHAYSCKLEDDRSKNGPVILYCNDQYAGFYSPGASFSCGINETLHCQCHTKQDNHCRGWCN